MTEPRHAKDDEPTQAFTPDWVQPRPCRCDECKYGQQPGGGLILDSRPGITDQLYDMAVRDGRYEDLEALDDEADWRLHAPAVDTERRIHRNIKDAERRLRDQFRRPMKPSREADLADALRWCEQSLARRLAGLASWRDAQTIAEMWVEEHRNGVAA